MPVLDMMEVKLRTREGCRRPRAKTTVNMLTGSPT
jgi:hypothetical protein